MITMMLGHCKEFGLMLINTFVVIREYASPLYRVDCGVETDRNQHQAGASTTTAQNQH